MTLLFKINGGSLQERHKIKRRKILSFWMPITNELEFLEAAFFFLSAEFTPTANTSDE